MKSWFTVLLAAGIVLCPAARAEDGKAKIEAFMADYLKLWNAHDAGAITARVYRLDGNNPARAKACRRKSTG